MQKLIWVSLLLLTQVLFPNESVATPPISWTPERVADQIAVGGSTLVSIELHFAEAANNVTIDIVPELSQLISILSPIPSRVNAGEILSVTMAVDADSNTVPKLYEGTIKVRSGRRALAKPLPVMLSVVSNPLLPIDNDQDGVWDDVQDFIDENYLTPAALHSAARQYAMATQSTLVSASFGTVDTSNAGEIIRALDCLRLITGINPIEITTELLGAILNSEERTNAYLLFQFRMSGSVLSFTPTADLSISSCDAN